MIGLLAIACGVTGAEVAALVTSIAALLTATVGAVNSWPKKPEKIG